ncbi:hypothetical protein EJ06DRAFT_532137 [Trichodelitschia bisporula]|uniref:Rhodopsin domain-containing protein n=1 Tax=Trichodelitschia bisporula TaxID=703511 RepID=A0A6G1HQQ3_9PEZI|nr:hypothetical protein EJ06DRAFT_532137 [Trichodelitschia bisporula]
MVSYLTGQSVIVADWILIGCAYILVGVRLWFRLLHLKQALTVSDLFLCVGALAALCVMILFSVEYGMGAMIEGSLPTPAIRKLAYTTVPLYATGIYCTKFSILAFYAKLFPGSLPKLRKACRIVMVYCACCYFVAVFLAVFWCGPNVSRNWAPSKNPSRKACSVYDHRLFKISFAMNISTDLLIFVLPFPLLATLSLSKRQLIGLCVTFGLGAITIAVSIGRCAAFLSSDFLPLYVWSMAEMCTALMVSSLPSLRPLLRKSRRIMHSSSPDHSDEPISRTWASSHSPQKSNKSNKKPQSFGSRGSRASQQERWRRNEKFARPHHGDEMASDVELTEHATNHAGIYSVEEVEVTRTHNVPAPMPPSPIQPRSRGDYEPQGARPQQNKGWV